MNETTDIKALVKYITERSLPDVWAAIIMLIRCLSDREDDQIVTDACQ